MLHLRFLALVAVAIPSGVFACETAPPRAITAAPPTATPSVVRDATGAPAPHPSPATATPVVGEKPAFVPTALGTFDVRDTAKGCEIWWKSATGTATKLLEVPDCGKDGPKLAGRVEEVTTAGKVAVTLPLVSNSGEEFRLFEIASARGGNATASCDYYAVVLDRTRAWGSPMFAARDCSYESAPQGPFERVQLVEDAAGASLRFIEPATGLEEGTAYEVTMGAMKTRRLPKLAVIAEETVVKSGVLGAGNGWRSGHYWMGDAQHPFVFEDGPCNLGMRGDLTTDGVKLKLRVRTYSDHSTSATCLAVLGGPAVR